MVGQASRRNILDGRLRAAKLGCFVCDLRPFDGFTQAAEDKHFEDDLQAKLGSPPSAPAAVSDDDVSIADLAALQALTLQPSVACELCGARMLEHRMEHHSKYNHGGQDQARLYVAGSKCGNYNTEFHCRPRLVRHL